MTEQGKQDMAKQLEALRDKRLVIAQQIKEARALGDLSENADYDEAKYQQAMNEGQIAEFEVILNNVEIVSDVCQDGDCAGLFTTVTLLDMDYDDEFEYTIVPPFEADHRGGLISMDSPIAEGLMDKSEGDEVAIETPGGTTNLRVLGLRPRDAK